MINKDKFSGSLVDMQTYAGVLFQTFLTVSFGVLFYLLVTLVLKSPELGTFKNSILTQIKKSDYGSRAD